MLTTLAAGHFMGSVCYHINNSIIIIMKILPVSSCLEDVVGIATLDTKGMCVLRVISVY